MARFYMGKRYKTATSILNILSFLVLSVMLASQIAMCFQAHYSSLYEFIERLQFYYIFQLGLCAAFAPDNEIVFFLIAFLMSAVVFAIGYIHVLRGKKKCYYVFSVMCAIDAIDLLVLFNTNNFQYLAATIAFRIVACIIFLATALTAPKTP